MQVIIERCAGFDVHQETVVACVLIGAPASGRGSRCGPFGSMTRDLEALRNWLQELGVTQVGMESTGVYWPPGLCRVGRAFRPHRRQRPAYPERAGSQDRCEGCRVDRRSGPPRTDCQELRSAAPQRELRELLRYRRKLVESQAAERNRLLKLLERANIKLASVASDVFGVSGRAMLKALIEGSASAEAMADLARGQLRRKRDDLVLALEGRMEEHHRFLLATQLRRLEAAEQDIAALDDRIEAKLESTASSTAC